VSWLTRRAVYGGPWVWAELRTVRERVEELSALLAGAYTRPLVDST
jgi:hypothetical protein